MKYRIKIVPKTIPNGDGEWREVKADLPVEACWLDLVVALGDYVPETHFLCAMERVKS
jgi:hypothetical protein